MSDPILERITLRFPAKDEPFRLILSQWMKNLGKKIDSSIELNCSDVDLYPKIWLDFFSKETDGVRTDFTLSSGEIYSLELANMTGKSRQSPHVYAHLEVEEVMHRLNEKGVTPVGIDHVGCNLPWFARGLHPQITLLRDKLLEGCLYHQFPTGEAWDFILPGEPQEIRRQKPVDYSRTRRPKFEIVSFEKASTPLVQFDLQLNASYEALLHLFPEALNDPDIGNLWIYLKNPYDIDVCVVANPYSEGDWSDFFKNSRLA